MEKFEHNNQSLLIESKGKNRVKITFDSFNEEFNYHIRMGFLSKEAILDLIQKLESFCTLEIKKEDAAYSEEINTYKDEVERTLSLSKSGNLCTIVLDVYTDKPFDDNWIDLTQRRLAYLIGLLYGYYNYA
ncbi:hypothetical protein ACSW8S_16695 (plasmid) [Clostridium perfringens]